MLRTRFLTALLLTMMVLPALAGKRGPGSQSNTAKPGRTRFTPLRIYIDSGQHTLGAYQFELKAQPGTIKIVGIEGGEHQAYGKPPYYDPAALNNDRIIIAAFSTEPQLPTGRTLVATLHLQVIGDSQPKFDLIPMAVANQEGNTIHVNATFKEGR